MKRSLALAQTSDAQVTDLIFDVLARFTLNVASYTLIGARFTLDRGRYTPKATVHAVRIACTVSRDSGPPHLPGLL